MGTLRAVRCSQGSVYGPILFEPRIRLSSPSPSNQKEYSPDCSCSEYIYRLGTKKPCRPQGAVCKDHIVDMSTVGGGMRGYHEAVERMFEVYVGFAAHAGVGLSEDDLNLRI